MEGFNQDSKTSKNLMKRPALGPLKKALASSKSKKFSPRLINKAKIQAKAAPAKAGSSRTKKKPKRGTLYIGHLPHGFYEEQLRAYFNQFGLVTGVHLPRSKKSGRSKGFAFVQFMDIEVAEVARQTMDKYLMLNRILDVSLMSPQQACKIKFNHLKAPVTPQTCRRAKNRQRSIAKKNSTQTEVQHDLMLQKERRKLEITQKKLASLGIPNLQISL